MSGTSRNRMVKAGVAALILIGVSMGIAYATRGEPAPAGDSISASDLRRDVFELASDRMGGRLVGTEGNRQAAGFIAERFDQLGLTPVGDDGGYLHRFDLLVARLGAHNVLTATIDGVTEPAELGVDFYPERFSATGQASGQLVFVGFGIAAPALDHDDFGDVDLRGRVVVMLDHEPGETDVASPFDGTFLSEHGRGVRKALEAQSRGAAAVLFVADMHNHSFPPSIPTGMSRAWQSNTRRVPPYQLAAWVNQLQIPVARISVELAGRLLGTQTEDLEDVSRTAEKVGGIEPLQRVGVSVGLETSIEREATPEYNVVGLVAGSDPRLRDEWVLLCAHYDHEGTTPTGLFRGADDDASGVAGLLDIAEAYARAVEQGNRPRRSVLFAAWNAEERGLLGAWAYTERPLTSLDDTVAVINMDMIGRHEEVPENGGLRFRGLEPQTAESNRNAVNLLGYSYSTDLRNAAESANIDTDLDLRFRYDDSSSNLLRRSDHWPFLFNGVPALFVHTGLHPDYHTERDEADKLDYEKMARIVRLVYQLSWDLAQGDERPRFN